MNFDYIVLSHRLEHEPVEDVAQEFRSFIFNSGDQRIFGKRTAQMILVGASLCAPESHPKLSLFAKHLADITWADRKTGRRDFTLRDYVMRTILKKLTAIYSQEGRFDKNIFCEYLNFSVTLFEVDFISPETFFQLATSIKDSKAQERVLCLSGRKVQLDIMKSPHDVWLNRLQTLLFTKMHDYNAAATTRQESSHSSDEDFVYLTVNEGEEEECDDENDDCDTCGIALSQTDFLPNAFQTYLLQIRNDPNLRFKLGQFKTCSEPERRQCALIMWETVPAATGKASLKCFHLTRDIERNYAPSNSSHKSFGQHLSEICDNAMVVKLEALKWTSIKNIGVYLGQLYNSEIIPYNLLQKWIDFVHEKVLKNNDEATKVYLDVFMIFLVKMKLRDPSMFYKHMLHLEFVHFPPQYNIMKIEIQRLRSFQQVNLSQDVATSSTNSPSRSFQPQPSKTIPKLLVAPPLKSLNVALAQISADNHEEILLIVSSSKIKCSEASLRKIANIIVTRVGNKPDLFISASEILAELPNRANPRIDETSFKNQLKASLIHEFSLACKGSRPYQGLVGFINVLHNRKVIDDEMAKEIIEKLASDAFENEGLPLRIFLSVLKSFVHKIHATSLLTETKRTLEKHTNSSSQQVREDVGEALVLLASVMDIATAHAAESNEFDLQLVLNDLNSQNITQKAEQVKANFPDTPEDIETLVSAIVDKATADLDRAEIFARFLNLLVERFKCSEAEFKEKLISCCQETLLSNFNYQIKASELPTALTTISFFAELYNLGILNKDFMSLSLDLIWYGNNDSSDECLLLLMQKVGNKLERESRETVDKLIKKVREATTKEPKPRSTAKLEGLVLLQMNKWMVAVVSRPAAPKGNEPARPKENQPQIAPSNVDVISFVQNLTQESFYLQAEDFKNFAVQTERNAKTLVTAVWECAVANPEKSKLCAELCLFVVDSENSSFKTNLMDLLQRNVLKFSSMRKFSKETTSELTNVTIFISELFALGFVKEITYENLLKSAKYLSLDGVAQISLVVSEKISQSYSDHLKVRLLYLEDLIQDKLTNLFKEINDNVGEIADLISNFPTTE